MGIFDDGCIARFPDQIHRQGRSAPLAQTLAVAPLSPLPNPPPPTELTWHPSYPDWIARAKRLLAQRSYFRWEGPPIADERWKAIYPDRIYRARFLAPWQRAYTAPDPAILRVPVVQNWRPTYPLILRRAKATPPSQTVYPIQGTTIITAASCVEWVEDSVGRPEFTAEGFGRPSMICDVNEPGFLLLEDGGFLLLEDGGKILLEDQAPCTPEEFGRSILDEEAMC